MTSLPPGASLPPPEPPPAAYDALGEAKLLLRTVRAGALATLTPSGAPFATLVNVATMPDGSPIFLSSRLSAHTRQLERDPRMSLLLAQSGEGDPLSHPRLTVSGSVERADTADRRLALRARFLARHPRSALYADFGDFSFWRVSIETAHLNGGFGRTGNFQGDAIATGIGAAGSLIAAEADALDHINADHADALLLYATAIAGKAAGQWRASGIDPEGLDLICGDDTARVLFPKPVETPLGLQVTLKELAAQARQSSTNPR
jgi:putative heme iron utilization protein